MAARIPEAEIESIRKAIEWGNRVEPHPFLRCGDRVRVKSGPLQGLEGILVRKKNFYRLVLSVEILERSAARGSGRFCRRAHRLQPSSVALGAGSRNQPASPEEARMDSTLKVSSHSLRVSEARFCVVVFGVLLMTMVIFPGIAAAALAETEKAVAADNDASKKDKDIENALAFKTAEETRIYPNDLLYIQVFEVEQMTREYRVTAAGTLLFPLLPEPIRAAGLTAGELADLISRKCREAGVLSHPQIDVTIRESRLHSVAVAGAVRSPQLYPVLGHTSLTDILIQAGGVADDAGSTVTITRGEVARRVLAPGGEGTTEPAGTPSASATVTIDLRRLLETGDSSLNVDVYPGDHVTVQRAGVIYVLGAVNRAGGYVMSEARQNMTVLKAVALAGDLKSIAKAKQYDDPPAQSLCS